MTDQVMLRTLDFDHLVKKFSLLVKHGGNINAKNKDGVSLLALYVLHHLENNSWLSDQAIDYFLKNGADLNAQDCNGNTLLMKMVSYPLADIPVALLEGDITLKNKNGQSALDIAEAEWSDDWILGFFLPRARAEGNTDLQQLYDVPLIWEIVTGQDEIEPIQHLLEQGADINHPFGRLRTTALNWAMKKKKLKVVEFLLNQGAQMQADFVEGKHF